MDPFMDPFAPQAPQAPHQLRPSCFISPPKPPAWRRRTRGRTPEEEDGQTAGGFRAKQVGGSEDDREAILDQVKHLETIGTSRLKK